MKSSACLAIALLLYGTGHADIDLDNIAISKVVDSIQVDVTASKPCLVEHFLIDEPPQKIVVDLHGVANDWSPKNFSNLPLVSIDKIRTSQFQVSPELISRVVLDINRPVDYVVEELPTGIRIKFAAAAGEGSFSPWSVKSQTSQPKPSPAAKPAPIVKEEKPAQTAKPKVAIESFPRRRLVSYSGGRYRDPFKPLTSGQGARLMAGEVPAIENLSLVGIFDDESGNNALFEDAEGNGYILRPNDRVKNGYLVTLQKDKAIFQITEYGWTRTVSLELQLPELK
jgi:hypothetical protein